MHADLSRWNFRPDRHYSRVVVQQGRVSLDADANAQASILLHYMRTLAADLIGEFGGPSDDSGFAITTTTDRQGSTLQIGPGRYYVDGLLCEADPADGTGTIDYFDQPDGYTLISPPLPAAPFLVWLKVWERFISAVEDPDLREAALGLNGPDTTGRTRVVWQVFASPWPVNDVPNVPTSSEGFYDPTTGAWDQLKKYVFGDGTSFAEPSGTLMAQAVMPQQSTDACTLSPSSRYRGPENQLYRVEIHRDGLAVTTAPAAGAVPTFKWSRDNGSMILPIKEINGQTVSVTTLGRDPKLSVDVGNYVEIVDDAYASQGQPGPIPRSAEPLHLVTAVDPVMLTVTLDPPAPSVGKDPSLHPYLRRWDQDKVLVTKAGLTIDSTDQAIQIVVTDDGTWIDLEDGVQVQFSAGSYRAGDYWLIPARVITGDVEWPTDDTSGQPVPLSLPPEGVRYHVAPLAVLPQGGELVDVRLQFGPQTGVGPVVPEPPEEPSPAPVPAAKASRTKAKGS